MSQSYIGEAIGNSLHKPSHGMSSRKVLLHQSTSGTAIHYHFYGHGRKVELTIGRPPIKGYLTDELSST
jgi:hypothetical protein